MAQLTLQRMLGKRNPAAVAVGRLLGLADGRVRIEDADGHLLLGDAGVLPADDDSCSKYPVLAGEEVLGWVTGPCAHAEILAGTLSWFADKEVETKQLGSEVLNAYREINLIHRFSEKLATLLDTASVAEASIAQACQIAKASAGAVLLLNDGSGMFESIAAIPPDSAFEAGIRPGEGLIGGIAAKGNAEIVNDVRADPRYGAKDPRVGSMMCAPLKLKDRIEGVLVVVSDEPVTYNSGDLKLMSTLALQTATAIENSILYEKMLRAVKAEALEQTLHEVEEQKRKAEAMLLNILPESVAKELQRDGLVQPMYFEDVTVCFTDFVGFSKSTMTMAAEDVVQELNRYFTAFDRIIERYGLEKLKTIGDSYMFVSGLPTRRAANPIDAVLAALEIVEAVKGLHIEESGVDWKVRVGLHTGPVIAGVVGIRKFAFDIWGETVNLASRMESCGEANRVNISERTFARVKDFMTLEPRGRMKTKDGQDIEMYFVEGVLDRLMTDRSVCPPPAFERRYKLYFRENTPSFPVHLLA